jgi:hypothetical protein
MKTEYRKLEERVSVTRTGEECTYKTGDAVGRPSCGSTFLGHPDAEFFYEERGTDTNKSKRGKKERIDAFGGTHDE